MMNLKSSVILTSLFCLITAGLSPIITLAQPAKEIEFYCGRAQDEYGVYYPATRLIAGKRDRVVIIWKQNFGKISPQNRCKIVSDRFEEARKNKQFDLLIAGNDKPTGQGLICAIKHGEKKCDFKHMLFTMNTQVEAKEIVQRLYSSLRKNGSPVPQSSSSESIDIQELIDSMER